MTDLRGKRCFITGAASGIGRATALAAAGRGAVVLLTDVDGAALDATAEAIRRAGGTVAWSGAADIADHDAIVALAEQIHAAHGAMDVVMNVAGISTWGRIEDLSHDDWRRTIEVDLMGPISVLECFVPPMIAAGRGGHVVNVSSVAGLFGLPWHAPYSAAKFGLRGVSEVLRFDLRRHRIGVSLVCPGLVQTPLAGTTAESGTVKIVGVDRSNPAIQKLFARAIRRAATPEQVAERILDAVERDRYMVFTDRETRFLHWLQRKFAPPYELAMRVANSRFDKLAGNR